MEEEQNEEERKEAVPEEQTEPVLQEQLQEEPKEQRTTRGERAKAILPAVGIADIDVPLYFEAGEHFRDRSRPRAVSKRAAKLLFVEYFIRPLARVHKKGQQFFGIRV